MKRKPANVLRCAVYTRKSTEHGLELEFNSLDAQREACEAFIKSQASQGWQLLPRRYDDPAYSGGNMDRPALQKLLRDIEAGQVDVVVVYKIDRLTRSLSDFAKLVEIFDARSVSFVAVTQQFNTTTSMGRLTLNVLLSFAQFERELASERVKDKVAASRKKGKWTGGSVPLGYDSRDKRLVINQAEAKTVRLIFTRYLALKSFQKLIDELNAKGIVSKRRQISGKTVGGIPFTYGPLAYLLKNRTYIGEIGYDERWFPGKHEPIVERTIFDKVQGLLKAHSQGRTGRRHRAGALLTGLLYDDRGNRMSPSFTVKNGVRYPCYVSSAALRGNKGNAGSIRRVPAPEIESTVLAAIRIHLTNGNGPAVSKPSSDRELVDHAVSRIVLEPNRILLTPKDPTDSRSPFAIPWLPKQRNRADVDETGASTSRRVPNPHLVQALVRAHTWHRLLADNRYSSIEDLAQAVGLNPKVIRSVIRLAFLPPAITKAILLGEQPAEFTVTKLAKSVPLNWAKVTSSLVT